MTFNSVSFLLFAAVFFAVWPRVRALPRTRWLAITAFSFFFYACWDWRFLFLLAGNGLVDYFVGLGMERHPRARRLLLVTSIAANVGTLALFKYAYFFTSSVNTLLGAQLPEWRFVLPVGISFYTFHSMSYIVDVYRGRLRPTRNLLHFYSYLSLFPHLVAGPIIRGADFLPQLERGGPASDAQRWSGLQFIAHGFFKKCVIADGIAPVVRLAFSRGDMSDSAVYWWLVAMLFGVQIYCDFSGYSDIARGLARWMGYEFPINFDHPYTAVSFRDFWKRWHISLSSWFRDYVYIPLGGSRLGVARSHLNAWIAMVVSGLWHGANWTFLVWGGLHALYLSAERQLGLPQRLGRTAAGRVVAAVGVYLMVTLAWVFFRSGTLDQAVRIVRTMLDPRAFHVQVPDALDGPTVALLGLALGREAWVFARREWLRDLPAWTGAADFAAVVGLLVAAVFLRGPGSRFIYFQF